MRRITILSIIALATSLIFSGCATTVVPEPGKITLEEALASVGRGLVKMKVAELEAAKKDLNVVDSGDTVFQTGLIPSEVEVTFNVSASGEQKGSLYVELTPTNVLQKAGGEIGTSMTATRGNQITIKFKNIAFRTKAVKADKTEIYEGFMGKDEFNKAIESFNDNGIIIFSNKYDLSEEYKKEQKGKN